MGTGLMEVLVNRISALAMFTVVVANGTLAQQAVQSKTIIVQPAAVAPGCSMISAQNGSSITSYGSVAASPRFDFSDPLPPGSIVSAVRISVSMLGACSPSVRIRATLNPSLPRGQAR